MGRSHLNSDKNTDRTQLRVYFATHLISVLYVLLNFTSDLTTILTTVVTLFSSLSTKLVIQTLYTGHKQICRIQVQYVIVHIIRNETSSKLLFADTALLLSQIFIFIFYMDCVSVLASSIQFSKFSLVTLFFKGAVLIILFSDCYCYCYFVEYSTTNLFVAYIVHLCYSVLAAINEKQTQRNKCVYCFV